MGLKLAETPDNFPDYDEIIRERKQRKAKEAVDASLTRAFRKRGRYRDCTVGNYRIYDERQKEVVAAITQWAKSIHDMIARSCGIVMFGNPGTGKDHIAAALLKWAARNGYTVGWVTGAEMFASLRSVIDEHRAERETTRLWVDPDLMVVSDPTIRDTQLKDWQAMQFCAMVDRRYNFPKPTIVTTNRPNRKAMETAWGWEAVDRLWHCALTLEFSWDGMREPLNG